MVVVAGLALMVMAVQSTVLTSLMADPACKSQAGDQPITITAVAVVAQHGVVRQPTLPEMAALAAAVVVLPPVTAVLQP